MSTVDFIPVLSALKTKLQNDIIPNLTDTSGSLDVAQSLKLIETLTTTLNTEDVGDTKIAAISQEATTQIEAIQAASTTEQNTILALLASTLGDVALTTDVTLNTTQYGKTMISFSGEIYSDIIVTVPSGIVGGRSFFNKTTGLGSVWVKVSGSTDLIFLPRNQWRHTYNDGTTFTLSAVDKYLDSNRVWKLGSKYNGDNSNRPKQQSWYIMRDRTLAVFGESESGEFATLNSGDNNHVISSRLNPSNSIPDSSPVKEIFNGFAHAFTLLENGELYCIGYNLNGGLGLGDTITRNRWVKHPLSKSITGVSPKKVLTSGNRRGAFNGGTSVLMEDGKCYSWGYNAEGQIGDGTTVDKSSPVLINSGEAWSDIFGSNGYSSCRSKYAIVASSKQVKSWGLNDRGQLGVGDTSNRSSPTLVSGLPSGYQAAKVIATTSVNSALNTVYGHALVLLTDGRVYGSGWNNDGQLGDGTTSQRTSFVSCGSLSTAIDIALSGEMDPMSMALLSDGTVRTWGYNGSGQIGMGNTTNYSAPQNPGLANIKKIMTIGGYGYSTCFALDKDGQVWGWGYNGNGQAGSYAVNQSQGTIDGTITVPTKIAQGKNKIVDMNFISANDTGDGPQFLTDDGKVLVCGINDNGKLGMGPTTSSYGYANLQEVSF